MSESLRRLAVEIYNRGLEGASPQKLLRQAIRLDGATLSLNFLHGETSLKLRATDRITVLAVGKAAAPMAAEAQRVLGERIAGGLVVTKAGFSQPGLPFPVIEAGHPVPDEQGLAAAGAVETLVAALGKKDLLLVLVSGGASALLPAPVDGVSLADKQRLSEAMLRAAMDIHQMNRVRKALSRLKGGGLAALASPARVVGCYLSDVPGDEMGVIGSGLTVPEDADPARAVGLLQEMGLWDDAPSAIREALSKDRAPRPQPAVSPVNGLIGTNRHLLQAMRGATTQYGFQTQVLETPATGTNEQALGRLLARWEAHRRSYREGPLSLICGGETVVNVTGKGKGGRCQELASMMFPRLDEHTVFLAAGSDGNDGPTDAAGGVVDRESWQKVRAEGTLYREMLREHDSYRLLDTFGNLIRVAPTRNNLMDVYLFLRETSEPPGPITTPSLDDT